jgi:hypothetical protein
VQADQAGGDQRGEKDVDQRSSMIYGLGTGGALNLELTANAL